MKTFHPLNEGKYSWVFPRHYNLENKKMIARNLCQGNFERKIANVIDYNTNTHTQSQIKWQARYIACI
jgi:hypothetical protein